MGHRVWGLSVSSVKLVPVTFRHFRGYSELIIPTAPYAKRPYVPHTYEDDLENILVLLGHEVLHEEAEAGVPPRKVLRPQHIIDDPVDDPLVDPPKTERDELVDFLMPLFEQMGEAWSYGHGKLAKLLEPRVRMARGQNAEADPQRCAD